jgi:ubiquinone/menaquinone biosynthesis C-methylase UbiE
MRKYKWELHYKYDKGYWWSKARRELVVYLVEKYIGSLKNKKILDIGCGSGVLIDDFIKREAEAYGVDMSLRAAEFFKKRGLDVKKGKAEKLPYKNQTFDAVCAIDLLEHIKSEKQTLKEARRVLKRNGVLVVFAPAFRALWSSRDDRLGHVRRYKKGELEKKLTNVGFKIIDSNYYVFLFFPFWLIRVLFEKLSFGQKNIKTDLMLVPKWLSKLLLSILRIENFFLRFVNFPFGVSTFVVGKKR